MKGLLIKDLYLISTYKKQLIILIGLFIAVSFVTNNETYFATLSFLLVFQVVATLSLDERSCFDTFVFTLPISVKQYVGSKYILTLILGGIGLLINLVGYTSMAYFLNHSTILISSVQAGLIFLICLFLGFLFLPVSFKWGAEKGRLILISAFITVMIGGSFLVEWLSQNFPEWMRVVTVAPSSYLVGGLSLITIITGIVSYRISLKIVRKK